jgi:hypothetical protein
MKRVIFILILFIFNIGLIYSQSEKDKFSITGLMDKQATDWTNGNIEAFMEGYWKSDSLMFIGSKGITYGWQSTFDNYKKGYPDRATMGSLKFDILKMDFHSKNTCWLLGKWHLTRPEKGDVGGYFTLIFKKIKGKWLIVSDHTS